MGKAIFHEIGGQKRVRVIETIKTALQSVFNIVFAFIHGSFFPGAPFRDIDVGVFLDGDLHAEGLDIELDLSQKIEEAFEYEFPVQVKIVNQAPPSFRFSVVRGKLLFARDEDGLVDFMIPMV